MKNSAIDHKKFEYTKQPPTIRVKSEPETKAPEVTPAPKTNAPEKVSSRKY